MKSGTRQAENGQPIETGNTLNRYADRDCAIRDGFPRLGTKFAARIAWREGPRRQLPGYGLPSHLLLHVTRRSLRLATDVEISRHRDFEQPSDLGEAARNSPGSNRGGRSAKIRTGMSILVLACVYASLHGAIAVSTPRFEPTVHNDDWAYTTPVRTLCERRQFQLHRLTGALALPQIVAGWVVCELGGGFRFSLLRNMMVWHGFVPIVLLWLLLRLLGLPRGHATCGALLFLTNPIVVSLTWSFQTDIVYVSFILAALIMTLLAERHGNALGVAAATLLLLLACLTRQSGILVAAGVAGYWAMKRRWGWAMLTSLVIPLTLAAENSLILQSSLTYLPMAKNHVRTALSDLSPGRLLYSCYETLHILLFLGLTLLPLIALANAGRHSSRSIVMVIAAAILIAGVYLLDVPNHRSVLLGNYVYTGERWGIGPPTLEISNAAPRGVATGGESTTAARVLGVVGFLSGCYLLPTLALALGRLVGAIRRWQADPQLLVELAFWSSLAGTICSTALIGHVVVDRYVIALCPLATPLLLRRNVSARSLRWAVLPVCLFGASVAWAGVVDYWRWNGARWAAAEWLESQAVSPDRIDGGYEYNALYDTLGLPPELLSPEERQRRAGIMRARAGKDAYCLRFRPRPDEDVVAQFPYDSPTMGAAEAIYVTRQAANKTLSTGGIVPQAATSPKQNRRSPAQP